MSARPDIEALPATSRVFELDILRGIAILLVLGVHSPAERGASGLLRPLDGFTHQFGWTGVDLFFVLSGFLIGRLLFAEIQATGQLQVRRFLVRRMFRIWPGYYALLLYALVRASFELAGGFGEALRAILPGFFHIQNFVPVPRDQLWSLAVEEHFYLGLPFLLWFLVRRGNRDQAAMRLVPWLSLGLSVVCLALRLICAPHGVDVRAVFSLDALFFGVNLAYLSVYRPSLLPRLARHRGALLLVGGLLLAPALLQLPNVRLTVGATSVYLGYGLILITFIHKVPGGLVERLKTTWLAHSLARIGTYSYSIYLWHRDASYGAYELVRDLGRAAGLPGELVWVLHTLAYVGASIAGGVIMERLIEAPALRLREKLFPADGAARPVSVPADAAASPLVPAAPG